MKPLTQLAPPCCAPTTGEALAPSFDHGVGDPRPEDISVTRQHRVVLSEARLVPRGCTCCVGCSSSAGRVGEGSEGLQCGCAAFPWRISPLPVRGLQGNYVLLGAEPWWRLGELWDEAWYIDW